MLARRFLTRNFVYIKRTGEAGIQDGCDGRHDELALWLICGARQNVVQFGRGSQVADRDTQIGQTNRHDMTTDEMIVVFGTNKDNVG